jgi:hypothetical protein
VAVRPKVRENVIRFLDVLISIHIPFIDDGALDELHQTKTS